MWQTLLRTSLEQGLLYAVMALGVYITFRLLDFPDLTVDGSLPLGGAVAASLMVSGHHPVIATAIAVLAGAVAGCMTGIIHTKLRINELLSGILMMTALYSINLRIMGRPNIALLRESTLFSEANALLNRMFPQFPMKYLYLIVLAMIALTVKLCLDILLRTEFGFCLRATGDNPQMVRSLGMNTNTTRIIGLSLSNALVALAGALACQYQGFADAGMGTGTIVAGLASVIIGEAIMGRKSIFTSTLSVVVGSSIYRCCITAALSLGWARASDLKLLTALVVIASLTAPKLKATLKNRIVGCRNAIN